MNKISKYMLHLRQIHISSFNILKQLPNAQKNAISTRNLPSLYFFPIFKTKRHISNTNQIDVSNIVGSNDILLSSIKTAKKMSDVLEMIRLHNPVMNLQQHLQALNSLFILQKNNRTTLTKDELTRSPEFTALCHKIQKNARNLELTDLINSIKCLSYLGVSVNSNIMQVMLQLMSKMINDMSLQQINFLQFLLKDLASCPLVDALKIALPIVFETQVYYKLEDSLYSQIECLNFITKYNLSQATFDFVMSRIIKNIDQLEPKIVKSLLLSLYYNNYSTDKYIEIINKCLHMILNHIEHVVNLSDIEAILTRMINKYFNDSEVFYNEQFINKIVEHTIKMQYDFEDIGYIIKKFNRIGYVHCGLLDHMTYLLANDHKLLDKSKFGVLLSYIGACANANYVPRGFIELKPLILKRLGNLMDVLELPWIVMLFDLTVLDCWSEELLERVFSRDFLYGFLKRGGNIHDYVMLLKLYQVTMTLYPGGYKGTLPPAEIIEKAINICYQNVDEFPLKFALDHGLGGSDYVLTGVRSKLGHFIDHLVVMRPGGYSVAINNEITDGNSKLLENIIESNDNLVIGIMLYKPNSYVINLNTLRGTHVITNKTLEALGVLPLHISMDLWNGLLEYEKIPYLMREIKTKADANLIEKKNSTH